MWANRMNWKVTFEQAQQIVEWRKPLRNIKILKKIVMERENREIEPKDLPGVDFCYLLASAKGKHAIDNLNSCLSVEKAKKIVQLWRGLCGEEWIAIVRKELPKLYSLYKSWLHYYALYNFIRYRAGEDFDD